MKLSPMQWFAESVCRNDFDTEILTNFTKAHYKIRENYLNFIKDSFIDSEAIIWAIRKSKIEKEPRIFSIIYLVSLFSSFLLPYYFESLYSLLIPGTVVFFTLHFHFFYCQHKKSRTDELILEEMNKAIRTGKISFFLPKG